MKRKIRRKGFLKVFLTLLTFFLVFTLFLPVFAYADSRSNVEAFVVRFYQQCLGRAPDPAGLASWTDQLVSGRLTGAQVANGFIFSPELTNKNVSNDEFLQIMYRAFFNRQPDPGGYSGWLGSMNSGMSRQAVLAGFINSQEFANLCASYGIQSGNLSAPGRNNAPPPAQPSVLPAQATAPAPKVASAPLSANLNAYETRVLELLNAIRAEHGLGPLRADQSLTNISRSRSADMIARNYFSHTTPDGKTVFNILRENGISYSVAGENLAHSMPASAGTPEAFVNAWMASPGHRANVLRAGFSKIGIGLADGSGRRVVTNVFTN